MGIASKLDRQVQFKRLATVSDGQGGFASNWQNHGPSIAALRQDVTDTEKFRAGLVQARLTTRFQVRSSEFTRDINPADRLICEGQDYDITGIKEAHQYGRRQLIELTCWRRSDV